MKITHEAQLALAKIFADPRVLDLKFSDDGDDVIAQLVQKKDDVHFALQSLRVKFVNQTADTILTLEDGQFIVKDYPLRHDDGLNGK